MNSLRACVMSLPRKPYVRVSAQSDFMTDLAAEARFVQEYEDRMQRLGQAEIQAAAAVQVIRSCNKMAAQPLRKWTQ